MAFGDGLDTFVIVVGNRNGRKSAKIHSYVFSDEVGITNKRRGSDSAFAESKVLRFRVLCVNMVIDFLTTTEKDDNREYDSRTVGVRDGDKEVKDPPWPRPVWLCGRLYI